MNITEFIGKFVEQFDEEIKIAPSTNFRELEQWSSLTALNVLMMIDEEYGVEFTADEMRKKNTIQELFDLVLSKL